MTAQRDLTSVARQRGWLVNLRQGAAEFGREEDGTIVRVTFSEDGERVLLATVEPARGERYQLVLATDVARVLQGADLALDTCPECRYPVGHHGGWGGPGCSLTDNGAAQRAYAIHGGGAR